MSSRWLAPSLVSSLSLPTCALASNALVSLSIYLPPLYDSLLCVLLELRSSFGFFVKKELAPSALAFFSLTSLPRSTPSHRFIKLPPALWEDRSPQRHPRGAHLTRARGWSRCSACCSWARSSPCRTHTRFACTLRQASSRWPRSTRRTQRWPATTQTAGKGRAKKTPLCREKREIIRKRAGSVNGSGLWA